MCCHGSKPPVAPTGPNSGPNKTAGGGAADGGSPPCPTHCTITSQTVATSPADRTRTRIGVGEEVDLTVNPAPATWAITSGSGTLTPNSGSQAKVRFTADDKAGSVTITATGSGCSCTITFTIVAPSDWTMKRQPGTNLNTQEDDLTAAGRGSCMYIRTM